MTDDAQAWVWQHSRTKNTARLVLLALAGACTDDTATARMGTAEMMRLANATKGTVIEGIARAVALGELEIREPGAGKRATLYWLPGAAGCSPASGREIGPLDTRSGRKTRPLDPPVDPLRSENPTASRSRSGIRTATPTASGRESGPLQPELTDDDENATRTRASSKAFKSLSEGVVDARVPERRTAVVPEFARPLVDRITASGVVVKWSLGAGEWFALDHLIQRSGVDMLAAAAVRAATRSGDVGHARYFLAAWRDLPPAPADGTAPVTPQQRPGNVVQFDANQPRRSRAQRTADELALILAREAQQ